MRKSVVGNSVGKRRNPLSSIFFRMGLCMACFLFIFATYYFVGGSSLKPPGNFIGDDTTPLVVLYHGYPEGAPNEWNTGVWPAWGEHGDIDMYRKAIPQRLKWQAEGAFITKGCDVHCHITHDQSKVGEADAVVMELINHYKFFGKGTSLPIPWPKVERGKPLLGMFHYEADSEFRELLTGNKEVMDRIDFTAIPKPYSDVPVTLVCTWGLEEKKFLEPSPGYITDTPFIHPLPGPVYVADFRGTIPPGYSEYFRSLSKLINIDFYGGPYVNARDDRPYILHERIELMGQYKFVIISESIIEDDWICPEYSQSLLSGAVPIYFGAPNIDNYLPGPGAIVNGRDFPTPESLAEYITNVGGNDNLFYDNHVAWKEGSLAPSFRRHLRNCAHLAECRICKKVLQLMSERE